jgi:hypothetical protein
VGHLTGANQSDFQGYRFKLQVSSADESVLTRCEALET